MLKFVLQERVFLLKVENLKLKEVEQQPKQEVVANSILQNGKKAENTLSSEKKELNLPKENVASGTAIPIFVNKPAEEEKMDAFCRCNIG